MRICRTLIAVLSTLILASALVQGIKAQSLGDMQTFFSNDYAGISITVDATNETKPNENLTVRLWINCTATGVKVDYLNISVYGFKGGQESIPLSAVNVMLNNSLVFNQTSEHDYNVSVPSDVWGVANAGLYLRYSIYNSNFEINQVFSITNVRNIYYEKLQEDFENLTKRFQELNTTYWQLNNTFEQLQQNYTALQKTIGDIDNTRRLAVILGITTIFFVVTTFYLIMRKPRDHW